MQGFNYKKAVQCLNFFAQKGGGAINKMKAIKLIWLADRRHLRTYARPVVFDSYWAMPYGPVQSSVKDLAEDNDFLAEDESTYRSQFIDLQGNDIISRETTDSTQLSQTDSEVLDEIYQKFSSFNAFDLAELSHLYPEWKKYETQLKRKEGSRFPMEYIDFFDNPIDLQDDFFKQDQEQLDLTKSIFQENMMKTAA